MVAVVVKELDLACNDSSATSSKVNNINNVGCMGIIKRNVNDLVETHTRMIYTVVQKLGVQREFTEDAIAEGKLALVKAAKNYKEETGYKFSTYAYSCVLNKIRWFIAKNRSVTFGNEVVKASAKVNRYMKENNIESVDKLSDEDWCKLSITNSETKRGIVGYFTCNEYIDECKENDESSKDIIDLNSTFEDAVVSKLLVNDIHSHIEAKYSKKSEKAREILKFIIDYIVENGTCDLSVIAKHFDIKRQTVYKYLELFRDDAELRSMLL